VVKVSRVVSGTDASVTAESASSGIKEAVGKGGKQSATMMLVMIEQSSYETSKEASKRPTE
jgi:hypothetical protein